MSAVRVSVVCRECQQAELYEQWCQRQAVAAPQIYKDNFNIHQGPHVYVARLIPFEVTFRGGSPLGGLT